MYSVSTRLIAVHESMEIAIGHARVATDLTVTSGIGVLLGMTCK
jgi:hypothetical protein